MTIEHLNHKAQEPAAAYEPASAAEVPRCVKVAGHEVTVFVESPPLFEAMLRDMAAARARVWLETYIFFNDDGGRRIAEALMGRAREGLDVRVLYDAIGSAATPAAFFEEMRDAGVKVYEYHSILEGFRRFRPLAVLNRRDHRKLFIVDDTAAYFGGMNIIDNVESVQQEKAEKRPTSSGWRDVHLRIAGPQQWQLADSFQRSWNRVTRARVPMKARMAMLRRRRRVRPAAAGGEGAVEYIHFFDSNGGRFSRAPRVYARMLRAARSRIVIAMAYFIPIGLTLRALLAARRRRVAVRIVVPGESDVKLVQSATAHLYDRLIRRGFRIYERRQRMLHSKVIVIDGLYTLVGSANLDPRSLYTNREFVAVIRSVPLAGIMEEVCRYEISQSHRITRAECLAIPRWRRFLNTLAWSVRWWL